jgi:hypothetical protein
MGTIKGFSSKKARKIFSTKVERFRVQRSGSKKPDELLSNL